jgi:hypothetical protein
MSQSEGPGSYVLKVRADTQRYAHELLLENDRLRTLVAALESDRQRLEERSRNIDELLKELDGLRSRASVLAQENHVLQERLLAANQALESHAREHARLERRLAEVETEGRRFAEQYQRIEAQNSNLANLYVASYRLHGTLHRQEVLAGIQEIVANLIGSEELAIYEMNADGTVLRLVASYGIDPAAHASVPVGVGRIGRAAVTGQPDLGPSGIEDGAGEAHLTACVPLKLDGRVTGALALFRLLPQKAGFEALDHELFDLLATHAATALYCTGREARLGPEGDR